MGKRKQRAVIREKKENSNKNIEPQKKVKKGKSFKKNSLLIVLTVLLFIIDFLSVTTISFSFSDQIIGNNISNLENFGLGEFWVFTKTLFLGIVNGLILIFITILLKRFFNK